MHRREFGYAYLDAIAIPEQMVVSCVIIIIHAVQPDMSVGDEGYQFLVQCLRILCNRI